MSKHPHAELMALYAQDAMETKKPWLRWEIRMLGGSGWYQCPHSPLWDEDMEYRRKPPTITRTITHPMPMTEPLEDGQEYWLSYLHGLTQMNWEGTRADKARLGAGCIFLTREDAEAHFEAHYRGWRDD